MQVQQGDVVGVRYTGRLDNGEVFDSNEGNGDPLEFRVGASQVIAGFEAAVMGLRKGDARTVRIEPAEAYGARDERLIQKLEKKLFDGQDVDVGMHLDLEDESGNVYHADVIKVDDAVVTVDLNHHLAGQALTFDIKVESIQRS